MKKIIASLILILTIGAYKFDLLGMRQPKSLEIQAADRIAEKINTLMNSTNLITFNDLIQTDTTWNLRKTPAHLHSHIAAALFNRNRNTLYTTVFKNPVKVFDDVEEWEFDTQGGFVAYTHFPNNNETLSIIDFNTMQPTQSIPVGNSFEFNPDNSMLNTQDDTTLKLYKRTNNTFNQIKTVTSETLIDQPNTPLETVDFLFVFDPLNQYFLTSYYQGRRDAYTVWDINFNKLATINSSLTLFTPQGNLITEKDNAIEFKKRSDILSTTVTHVFDLPSQPNSSINMAVFKDKEIAAVAFLEQDFNQPNNVSSTPQPIIIYELATNQQLSTLGPVRWNKDVLDLVTFSKDGSKLATGNAYGNNVYLWDLDKNFKQHELTEPTDEINGISFNDDATLLAATSQDTNIYIWDIAQPEPKLISTIPGHDGHAGFLKFSLSPLAGNSTAFGGCMAPDNQLRLFLFPAPDTFGLDQLIFILTIAQAPNRNLSSNQMAQLKNRLRTSKTLQAFAQPWMRTFLTSLINRL